MYVSSTTEKSSVFVDVKGIQESIPFSDKVDSVTFSRLLDDNKVVASYKMYWLLGILDEVSAGNTEIEFKRIISRMIVYAWYPILQYKLSFGSFDNLKNPINYAADKYKISSNYNENKLLDIVYNNNDKELQKMMKELTYNVPYRLLSPFFVNELRGLRDSSKNMMITQLSLSNNKCLYKIIKGEEDKISLNSGWAEYMKYNYKLIKAWIFYKIICFLQKRNPNVPAIAFKLEAPKSRKLTTANKLWTKIITSMDVRDIYTGREFNEINFKKYRVLSIDHFIPWSFVLHDEMWNLVPTFNNINISKSDNLLPFDNYINKFCEAQFKAFSYICNKRRYEKHSKEIKDTFENYVAVLRLDNPYDYCNNGSIDSFGTKIKQCISPLYQIAVNQGFQVMEKFR